MIFYKDKDLWETWREEAFLILRFENQNPRKIMIKSELVVFVTNRSVKGLAVVHRSGSENTIKNEFILICHKPRIKDWLSPILWRSGLKTESPAKYD